MSLTKQRDMLLMNSPTELANLVMTYGPQKAVSRHRALAISQNMVRMRYEMELEIISAMSTLAYRYGRKKAAAARKLKETRDLERDWIAHGS